MRTANARRPAADHWSRRRFDAHAVAKPPHIAESAPASDASRLMRRFGISIGERCCACVSCESAEISENAPRASRLTNARGP